MVGAEYHPAKTGFVFLAHFQTSFPMLPTEAPWTHCSEDREEDATSESTLCRKPGFREFTLSAARE
jgi:hypothetical protein